MKKLCVIGDPVEHSKSPLIHNAMLERLGLDYVYGKERVAKEATALWVARAVARGYAGFNATMPHKEQLVPLMDMLDEDARMYGSVNTVCIKNDKLYGYNTDGEGFLAALGEAGIAIADKRVALLGAGGAAKAVALKLCQQGAARITVCNRTIQKAEELCRHNPAVLVPADFSPDALSVVAAQCDLLVNCTSLGMEGVDKQFENFAFLEALPAHAAVCDLIYAPPETKLLRCARELGHRTMSGLGMLVWQAVFALEHFTDTEIDGAAMAAMLKSIL